MLLCLKILQFQCLQPKRGHKCPATSPISATETTEPQPVQEKDAIVGDTSPTSPSAISSRASFSETNTTSVPLLPIAVQGSTIIF